jgi:hypothetical protein
MKGILIGVFVAHASLSILCIVSAEGFAVEPFDLGSLSLASTVAPATIRIDLHVKSDWRTICDNSRVQLG